MLWLLKRMLILRLCLHRLWQAVEVLRRILNRRLCVREALLWISSPCALVVRDFYGLYVRWYPSTVRGGCCLVLRMTLRRGCFRVVVGWDLVGEGTVLRLVGGLSWVVRIHTRQGQLYLIAMSQWE